MRNSAHFSEVYLHRPEKLAALEADKVKHFWAQRSWHPFIKMIWNAEIVSNGEGLLTYPDGSISTYELTNRP